MELRQLEYLNALAAERHFGRAAAACHVSQPALSSSIRKLERELGVTLVHRTRSFDSLTAEGEILLGWAQRVTSDVTALRDEANRLRGELTGTVRLGVVPTAMPAMALITEGLLNNNPGLGLTVRALPSQEIVRQLASHELDGGISYLDDEPLGDVATFHLYDERYFLLATAGGLGRHRRGIGWAELAELPLCLLTPDLQNRRIIDAALRSADVSATPRVEASDITGLLAFARAGYACVVAHAWLALHGLPRGMRAVAIDTPMVTHSIGLVTLPLEPPPPFVRVLRTELPGAGVGVALTQATAQWLSTRTGREAAT
ncbi:MAG TPA: LysR family transcriptional regulator [Baekduia sp.]|nr:LysR family transcriptional regulator [Baekduia sp.]